jgi:uncharacterized iron-regulated protein
VGLTAFRALPRSMVHFQGLAQGQALVLALVLALALILTGGCARIHPPTPTMEPKGPPTTPGALFHADGVRMEPADLAGLVDNHDVILIGESHTNPCDHQFQENALSFLAASGTPLFLGLEMVPWSRQSVLDDFNAGRISLDALKTALSWEDYWGYTFDLYAPILGQAKNLNVPLVGLNVPRHLLQHIREHGLDSIPLDQRGSLPQSIIPPPPDQRAAIEDAFSQHMEMMPEQTEDAGFALDRFMLVQSLWDTQMASVAGQWVFAEDKRQDDPEMTAPRASKTMVILVGSGHVEHGHGIAHRLRLLHDNARILSILPWRESFLPDPTLADLFFYCPVRPHRLGLEIAWSDEQATVSEVLPDSLAAKAGMLPGDILLQAGEEHVDSMRALHQAALRALGAQTPLRLVVLRNGQRLAVDIAFEDMPSRPDRGRD